MNSYTRRPGGLLVPQHVNLGEPRVVHCRRERHHIYIWRNPKRMAPSKWDNRSWSANTAPAESASRSMRTGCARTAG